MNGNSWSGAIQNVALSSGKSYTVRAWFYVESGDPRLTVRDTDAPVDISYIEFSQSKWCFDELTWQASNQNHRIYLQASGSPAEFYVDSLQLFENKATNPGFEADSDNDGLADDWIKYDDEHRLTFSLSDGVKHSGSYSQKIEAVASENSNYARIEQPVTTIAGRFYEIAVWVYISSLERGYITVGVYDHQGYWADNVAFNQPTSDWIRVSFVVQATGNKLRPAIVFSPSAVGTVYIDDVTVRPIYDVPLICKTEPIDFVISGSLTVNAGGRPIVLGRGQYDRDVTYIALRDSNGRTWYIYPDGSGGLVVTQTKP